MGKRHRATATRAPQRGSRRWRKHRRRARTLDARHRRRITQAGLTIDAGRRHNLRLRQWAPGQAIARLRDKAAQAGLTVHLVNERNGFEEGYVAPGGDVGCSAGLWVFRAHDVD